MALPSDDIPNDQNSDGTADSSPNYQQVNVSAKRVNFEVAPRDDDSGPIKEKWFVAYWRPAMAWLYMSVIAFDFIIAPIMSMILPILPKIKDGIAYSAWHPLTLEGGGLIHLTFGAVLGITAWGRTKEKTSDTSDPFGG